MCGQNPDVQTHKGPAQALLQNRVASTRPGFDPTHLGTASPHPGGGCSSPSRETRCPCSSPQPAGGRSDPRPAEPCHRGPRTGPEGGGCTWTRQLTVVSTWGEEFGRIWKLLGDGRQGAELTGGCWLVPEAEGGGEMAPKVVTGTRVGGWSEAGGRGVPGSVPSKHR